MCTSLPNHINIWLYIQSQNLHGIFGHILRLYILFRFALLHEHELKAIVSFGVAHKEIQANKDDDTPLLPSVYQMLIYERMSATFHKYWSALVSVEGNFCTVLGRTPYTGCVPGSVAKAKLTGTKSARGGGPRQRPPSIQTDSGGGRRSEDAPVVLALNVDAFVDAADEENRPFLRRFVRTSVFADWLVRHTVPY
jgi:hypothetical protein